MKYTIAFYIALFCVPTMLTAQEQYSFASRENRLALSTQLRCEVDSILMHQPIHDSVTGLWKKACWAMELMLYRHPIFLKRMPEIIEQFPRLNANMQWILLQTWYTLYRGKQTHLLQQLWTYAKTDKIKALLLVHMHAAKIALPISNNDTFIQSNYYQAFSLWQQEPEPAYQLDDILQNNLLPGKSLLISVQYRNRDIPGFLLIRQANGQWVRDSVNQIRRFPQLARSITNLPYFLTNGNTPQGLYRVTGIAVSSNSWIGPTKNLQLIMPFEEGGKTHFFENNINTKQQYAALLGNFRHDSALWQSYRAGILGRTEIIAHGTTIPDYYYSAYPFYPNTPSLGCLCSPEIWNQDGILTHSVQQQWMNIVAALPQLPAFLWVVEVK